MNKYCNHLNLDFPLFKENVDVNQFKQVYHTRGDVAIHLHPALLDFLNSINLQVTHLEMFYSKPEFKQKIHIDNTGNECVKINYVFGGANSIMNWYTIKDNIVPTIKETRIGTKYISCAEDEVNLVHQSVVKFPSLIQVGVPHNIINSSEDRLCVSLMLSRNKIHITMNEALTIFKPYII